MTATYNDGLKTSSDTSQKGCTMIGKSLTLRQVLEACTLANWEVFDINNEDYPVFTHETPLGAAINGYKGISLTRIMMATVENIEASQNRLIITINFEA